MKNIFEQNTYRIITLSREDLVKALEAFDGKSDFIHMAVEMDRINGDQILWVDNGKFGDNRKVEIINEPFAEA